ncbi:hypothetical protein CF327_g7354 [Tilletia walkeri]|uniref:Integrase catalytic domain-containing protein n=1 Tax=Tilletia walkeri TaxID=117179 RepID=A0A8X7N9L0_9BASI|nr:hypothetical protein CF327_g7354 [Tilletia walkeri]KAE8269722.1 hypothetical protein A4X09_0g2623 [Tilletia walkeri]
MQVRHFSPHLPPQQYDAAIRDLVAIRAEFESREQNMEQLPAQQTWFAGNRGAWTLSIDTDLLMELSELRFTDDDIGLLLGVSRSTIQRRRSELGISKMQSDAISHDQLCSIVLELRSKGAGNEGERAMIGAMRSLRLHVSRARLRLAVAATDPFRALAVRRDLLPRRVYSVPFVNSLWHLDGHHKLIRWRLVIHAAIDGKSRVVTFIRASSDNRAETVARSFLQGTTEWGWPSRVRADYGGENLRVKDLMELKRGLARGSFIQGASTHNQRIERLWVDLQRWTTDRYKALFQRMEQDEILDIDNPVEVWVLHFVFLPQLQLALQHFQAMWNSHPMSTQGLLNKSPKQMFVKGILEAKRCGWSILEGANEVVGEGAVLRDFSQYGTQEGEPRQQREDDPYIHIAALDQEVPPILLHPTIQEELRRRLPVIWPPPPDGGQSVYRKALFLVNTLLQSQGPGS